MADRLGRWVQIAFLFFFRPWMRSRIRTVRLGTHEDPLPGRPLLLVANHVSWWDGFLLLSLQRSIRPDARLTTVMLEREIRRVPFLRLLGATGLVPGSLASLRGLLKRLRDSWAKTPKGALAFFPQGGIWPSARRPLSFQPGIRRIARDAAPCAVLPIGLHVEPLNRLIPTAFVTVGTPILVHDDLDPAALEAAVRSCLDQTAQLLSDQGEALAA